MYGIAFDYGNEQPLIQDRHHSTAPYTTLRPDHHPDLRVTRRKPDRERRHCPRKRNAIDLKIERAMNLSMRITGARKGFLALKSDDNNLFFQKKVGINQGGNHFETDQYYIEKVMNRGWPLRGTRENESCDFDETGSICMPLRTKDSVLGVLYLENSDCCRYVTREDRELLDMISDQLSAAIGNARSAEMVRDQKTALKTRLRLDDGIIVESEKMVDLYYKINELAPINIPVMILGEPGTGKELIAQTLHNLSGRKGKFVALNCSAIPDGIFESELFGSVKGAFTNATDKPGKLELAEGGTVFLDEIGDMASFLQPKLLRFLENKEIVRLGDTRTRKIDVRVIAATNQNLEDMILQHKFRADLYDRLACFKVNVPPLRERKEDIPPLVRFFVEKFAREHHWKCPRLSESALEHLTEYHWPGNVRELRNIILQASVHTRGKTIYAKELPGISKKIRKKPIAEISGFLSMKDMEKKHIRDALERVGFNISKAAKVLGIARSTLHGKMRKYQIRAYT